MLNKDNNSKIRIETLKILLKSNNIWILNQKTNPKNNKALIIHLKKNRTIKK